MSHVLPDPHDIFKPFNYLGKGAELQLADLELVTLVGLLCLQMVWSSSHEAGLKCDLEFLSLAWQATKLEPLSVPNATICFAPLLFWRLFWGK